MRFSRYEDRVGVAPTSLVAELGATALPYDEELVRCTDAPCGAWRVAVANWSTTDEVDYEIAVLGGARVSRGPGTPALSGARRAGRPMDAPRGCRARALRASSAGGDLSALGGEATIGS